LLTSDWPPKTRMAWQVLLSGTLEGPFSTDEYEKIDCFSPLFPRCL
jgi:hypothetical protein